MDEFWAIEWITYALISLVLGILFTRNKLHINNNRVRYQSICYENHTIFRMRSKYKTQMNLFLRSNGSLKWKLFLKIWLFELHEFDRFSSLCVTKDAFVTVNLPYSMFVTKGALFYSHATKICGEANVMIRLVHANYGNNYKKNVGKCKKFQNSG